MPDLQLRVHCHLQETSLQGLWPSKHSSGGGGDKYPFVVKSHIVKLQWKLLLQGLWQSKREGGDKNLFL